MSRHLITGGAGFIGAALAHRLVAEGHTVTVLDRFSRGKISRIPSEAFTVKGDIRDPITVMQAATDHDVIWHLAYVQGTQTFYAEPKTVIDVALRGIMNVLRACELKEEPPELFLVSSSEVYQNPPEGMFPTDETVPLSVPDVTNPRYSYGGGKIASEIATLAYADVLKRAVIVRPHNVYGPDMGWDHVIPQFAVRLMELQASRQVMSFASILPVGEELVAADDLGMEVGDYIKTLPLPFRIQGSGQETRSFCYIDDCIDGLMVLLKKGEDSNIYHLGNPEQERTIADVAYAIADWFDSEIELVPGKLPKGSPTRRLPDVSKLAALGYDPKVSLEAGLLSTLSWYQHEVRQDQWKRVEERVRKAA